MRFRRKHLLLNQTAEDGILFTVIYNKRRLLKLRAGSGPVNHKVTASFMLDVYSKLILGNVFLIQLTVIGIRVLAIRR